VIHLSSRFIFAKVFYVSILTTEGVLIRLVRRSLNDAEFNCKVYSG